MGRSSHLGSQYHLAEQLPLFDEYIDMYSSRDERLLSRFSDNFSGYAGSSDILVTNKEEFDYHRPSAYELYLI